MQKYNKKIRKLKCPLGINWTTWCKFIFKKLDIQNAILKILNFNPFLTISETIYVCITYFHAGCKKDYDTH
jgi:hypothetical protein